MTEVYGGLNMNEEETAEFVFELLGGPPGSPVDGRAYVDTTADAFRVRINGEWLEFTIGAAVVDLAANRPASADAGDFFFASDTDLLSIWDGSAWVNLDYAASSHTHAASDVTSGTFANARIAAASVTQHQAALTITESQISDLGSYSTTGHTHAASDLASGTLADARVAQTNVTQHQAALSITESQISDLDHYSTADANAAIDARVDKTYVDALGVNASTVGGELPSAFADASHSHSYLALGGGTLTGALTLDADPSVALHAATKQYVDNAVTPSNIDGGAWDSSYSSETIDGGSL